MSAILWLCTIVLAINSAQSYILLTANLEDVQSIARQMANSPLAEQLKKIWHRASNQFHQQMGRPGRSRIHQRAEDDQDITKENETPPKLDQEQQELMSEDRTAEESAVRRQGDGRHKDSGQEDSGKEDIGKENSRQEDGGQRQGGQDGKQRDGGQRGSGQRDGGEDGGQEGSEQRDGGQKHGVADDLAALGRNASYYLTSIQNMMKDI